MSRLNSQLSLKRQETLSQVVLGNGNDVGGSNNMENVGSFTVGSWSNNKEHSETISTMGSWRENDIQPVMCSVTPFSSAKNINCDISRSLGEMENQLQFRMPHEALLEMETMDSYLHIPEVSVPCKVRAKRGCATHPRSIAERERRTRISGKLKKLQDLVPNMDKQTSYADMLDFAVQHIKSLQEKLQELNKDREQCTCGVVDA
ncbi:unnamed protein product [Cuscuta epithymum]|nr:unnamed protein product [Cuscuta epithymum]